MAPSSWCHAESANADSYCGLSWIYASLIVMLPDARTRISAYWNRLIR